MIFSLLYLACSGKDGPGGDGSGDSVEVLPGDSSTADGDIATIEIPDTVPDVVVDCNGGGDFSTIADAIAASVSGTHIGLQPCTYQEDVDFNGKSLDIFGIEGSAVTTITGTGYGPVVKAVHGESVGTRLAGVTISGGQTNGYYGSGLNMEMAVLTLEDVVFTDNNVGYSVLYAAGAMLTAIDVTFTNNVVTSGGGIQVVDNGTYMAQGLLMECSDTEFAIFQHLSLLLLDSDIRCGDVYGIHNAGGGSHVRRSRVQSEGIALFAEDSDDTRNERVWLSNSAFVGSTTAVSTSFMDVRAENNVFWGGEFGLDMQFPDAEESYVYNSAAVGSTCPIRTDQYENFVDLGWNALSADTPGCGVESHDQVTMNADFLDAPLDFSLVTDSLLRDAGDPDEDKEDVDGSRNDIGIYGGPEGAGQP